jgi:hypothetical protein
MILSERFDGNVEIRPDILCPGILSEEFKERFVIREISVFGHPTAINKISCGKKYVVRIRMATQEGK